MTEYPNKTAKGLFCDGTVLGGKKSQNFGTFLETQRICSYKMLLVKREVQPKNRNWVFDGSRGNFYS
jgi:hypothetical protein